MKDEINNWLTQKTALKGVVAAGIIYPDRTFFSQVFASRFRATSAEKIWSIVAEMGLALGHQRLPGTRLQWSFENFAIHHTIRNNGTALALLTTNKLRKEDLEGVEKLLTEFRALPL